MKQKVIYRTNQDFFYSKDNKFYATFKEDSVLLPYYIRIRAENLEEAKAMAEAAFPSLIEEVLPLRREYDCIDIGLGTVAKKEDGELTFVMLQS